MVGYVLNCIIYLSSQLSCWGVEPRNVSFLKKCNLGQSVTKCQKVSLSSPHSLHRGFTVGLALNWIQLRELKPVIIDISLVRCDLEMFSIFFAIFFSVHCRSVWYVCIVLSFAIFWSILLLLLYLFHFHWDWSFYLFYILLFIFCSFLGRCGDLPDLAGLKYQDNSALVRSYQYSIVRVWRARASASAHTRSYMSMHADPSQLVQRHSCLLYTSPSPRDRQKSRMPSSA